jgi:hypothetical protein
LPVFKKCLALLRGFKDSRETLKSLVKLLADVMNVKCTGHTFKLLLRELVPYTTDPQANESLVSAVLKAVLQMLKRGSHRHREVLAFSNAPNSGVGMVTTTLPRDGFGFFGWLRVEGESRSSPSETSSEAKMCIFQFSASKDKELELYIQDRMLCYSVHSFAIHRSAASWPKNSHSSSQLRNIDFKRTRGTSSSSIT